MDLVQRELSELAQKLVHFVKGCNDDKELLEEKFDSVRDGILIMVSQIETEKVRIESEVFRVASMMHLQPAVLQELYSGIHNLQFQDNQTVSEATDLFAGLQQELEAQSKRISDNTLQMLAVKNSNQVV
jgi:Mg2+ and Co2+ transporter CorA